MELSVEFFWWILEKLFVMYFDSQRYLGVGQNAQKAVFSEFDVCIVWAGSTGSSFKARYYVAQIKNGRNGGYI